MYIIKLAFKNIFHKKARTFFTALSIAVGVVSVLIISVISDFGKTAMNNELDSLGINGLLVSSKDPHGKSNLNEDDLSLLKSMGEIDSAIPIVTSSGSVFLNNKIQPIIIWGIDSGAEGIISFEIKNGEDISSGEVKAGEYCCLVDENSSNRIGDIIGINVNDKIYNLKIKGTVSVDSGIIKSLAEDYIPPIIYLPYTTVQNMIDNTEISQIAIKINDKNNSGDIIGKNIERKIFNNKSENSSIEIQNLTQQRNKLNNMLDIVSLALSAIGIVSLIVAGISIMTVMMMSVNERTKEIGIKRAIGAGKSSLMLEILTETAIISIIGCIMGVLFILVVNYFINRLGFMVRLNLITIIQIVLIAVILGVLFGLYPSIKAAKLEPAEALRKD